MKNPMRKRILHALLQTLVFLAFYILSNTVLKNIYTPRWCARHFLPAALVLSLVLTLLQSPQSGWISLAGYFLGNILGEAFGGFERHIPPQFTHHGWWICIVTDLAVSLSGALSIFCINRRRAKNG